MQHPLFQENDLKIRNFLSLLKYVFLILIMFSSCVFFRYEYSGHYFFSSDRVFVVLAPPTQLRHPASDHMLALLLAQDPHAVNIE
jgi:hypothetical protein